jgi:hypothetical protein
MNISTFTRRLAAVSTLFFAVVGLSGCASNLPMDYYLGKDRSLVYGYIDMSSAPTKMIWANMVQTRPKTDSPLYDFTINHGIIYVPNVPRGKFMVSQMGGVGKFNASGWTYNINAEHDRRFQLNTYKPGLHYIGSWKYIRTGKGLLKHKSFKLVPSKKMNEKAILEHLLTQATDPTWRKMISRRISKL